MSDDLEEAILWWGQLDTDSESAMRYTNVAVNTDGTFCPWPTHITTEHPPMLRFDGQIKWLPAESAKE